VLPGDPGVPELVVPLPLPVVAEDLIGLGALLEQDLVFLLLVLPGPGWYFIASRR
jgi:hypothetical protein